MAEFTILHRDDFERSGRWMLARRSLGLESFGMSVVEIEPGGGIPEHDEVERDQEEIFVVLEGDAAIVVDRTEHPAPAGARHDRLRSDDERVRAEQLELELAPE